MLKAYFSSKYFIENSEIFCKVFKKDKHCFVIFVFQFHHVVIFFYVQVTMAMCFFKMKRLMNDDVAVIDCKIMEEII